MGVRRVMWVQAVVLFGWWVYVYTYMVTPSPFPVWQWVPHERFLYQEFCDFSARNLRREGRDAICWYVDD